MATSKICMKRLMIDRKRYNSMNSKELGIYCSFSDDNMYNVKAMIIGPKDTPYEGGFYFFDINFTPQYPMLPPKVQFCTLNPHVRFNPNLYKCGKVCLSILGTWSGPSWTTVMNLETILIDLQSLMNDNPIQNEPGYESEIGSPAKVYKQLVGYYNLVVAQFQMMEQTPPTFECFQEVMERHFIENTEFFDKWRKEYIPLNNEKLHSKYSGMREQFLTEYWSTKIDSKVEQLQFKYPDWNSNITVKSELEEVGESKVENNDKNAKVDTKTKPVRKCPNEQAKQFEVGFTKEGVDGKLWVVKGYESGLKRWVKH